MGASKRRRSDRAGRGPIRSPGRPTAGRREDREAFWKAIARGVTSEDAALAVGVSSPVGTRWFRENGGMPPANLGPLSGRYLSFSEREEIAVLRAQRVGDREIARRIGRCPSTISRELRRNAATRSGGFEYRATTAQWHADRKAGRPKVAKLAADDKLRQYVQDRLAGTMTAANGATALGPNVSWRGRRHGRRQDRRWATSWSPSRFPSGSGSISRTMSRCGSHMKPSIKRSTCRAAVRSGASWLRACGQAVRYGFRGLARADAARSSLARKIMISERPAEAADRAVPGHWEGDFIVGQDSSAIGTLVERTTRFTMLLHLPRMNDFGQPRVKNGPALAGHGAEAVRDAIATAIVTLPKQLRRSLTWDQGAEMAQHAQLRIETGLPIYFCDPHKSVAARHQREYQRAPSPVLSQRHGPVTALSRRDRGRRG